jgi:cyclic pyranopterin phosphate synthase
MVRVGGKITELIDDQEIHLGKGPVFNTAIIAGTMAAKNVSSLIPLCHNLSIDDIKFDISTPCSGMIQIACEVRCVGRTGVEMEALTGASIAALTIYDMCKSVSFDMEILSTRLLLKHGGKNGIPQQMGQRSDRSGVGGG